MNNLRVVLDTNILIAGLRSQEGVSFELLNLLPERRFTLLLSVPLLLEYETVLKREEHLRASGLTTREIDTILDVICSCAKTISRMAYTWRPQLPDPKDEMVLDLALNGQADAIVTFNRQDFVSATKSFNLSLWSPKEFYEKLKEF